MLSAFRVVATPAEELDVLDEVRPTQTHRHDVVPVENAVQLVPTSRALTALLVVQIVYLGQGMRTLGSASFRFLDSLMQAPFSPFGFRHTDQDHKKPKTVFPEQPIERRSRRTSEAFSFDPLSLVLFAFPPAVKGTLLRLFSW